MLSSAGIDTRIRCQSAWALRHGPYVNVVVTQVNNNTNAQVVGGANGFLDGVSAFGGKGSASFQLSLRRKF